ncbi:chloramphenicol phosphotransferase CPT family protein [Shimia sp.]|uniref:chloramphenicol phosphotransferase CPT family protein n=1 Tax=Shimia sp. TaxID=1954381 RepID=UPI003BA9BD0A
MSGQIILLHGPSSSGKTTLARALQQVIELPFWHISIDHLRDSGVLPSERFANGDFDWRDARVSVFDGFNASLAAYAAAGNNLIIEHILDDPRWVDDLKRLLAPFDVYFVGLHCALQTLEAREQARGDRPLGSAAQDFHQVHEGRVYDLEIDSARPVQDNVARVLTGWRSGERRSEFRDA